MNDDVVYDGCQRLPDGGSIGQFTDMLTGSSFHVARGQSVIEKLREVRAKFDCAIERTHPTTKGSTANAPLEPVQAGDSRS